MHRQTSWLRRPRLSNNRYARCSTKRRIQGRILSLTQNITRMKNLTSVCRHYRPVLLLYTSSSLSVPAIIECNHTVNRRRFRRRHRGRLIARGSQIPKIIFRRLKSGNINIVVTMDAMSIELEWTTTAKQKQQSAQGSTMTA